MRTISPDDSRPLELGRAGENAHTRVVFDVSGWLAQYPQAAISILCRRAGDESAYPVPASQLETADGTLYWTVSAADTGVEGSGQAELVAMQEGVIVKSAVYQTQTLPALTGGGDPPDPVADWLEEAEAAVTAANAAAQAIEDIGLENLARVDGEYKGLAAGQLLATVGVTEKTPYNFRTSGGSADIGDREQAQAIVGGTVAWNQLDSRRTGTSHTDQWSAMWRTGEHAISIRNGHVYMFSFVQAAGCALYRQQATAVGLPTTYKLYSAPAVDTRRIFLVKADADGTISANTYFTIISKRETTETAYSIDNKQVFDLTQMFGSVIADAINALETANEGAGAAWFRALFPKAYYAYNAGELLSVNTSAHNTVGFNAFDVSTGKAALLGGQEYQITGTYTALSLDGASVTPDADGKFTPAANGELTVTGGDGTTCVHLVWSGYRDGDYEPYVKHSYPLDSSLTLRGIPKLDAGGSLYYDGDTYAPNGTVTRYYQQRAYQAGDESLTDAITDGTNTVVKLTTPTTESADPYQETQLVDDFGTEEYVDTRAVAVPVGHVTFYPEDLRGKLQRLPAIPAAPGANGTYALKCAVSGGVPTYSWEAEA